MCSKPNKILEPETDLEPERKEERPRESPRPSQFFQRASRSKSNYTPKPQPERKQAGEPKGELETGESAPQVKNSAPKRQNSAGLAESKPHPTYLGKLPHSSSADPNISYEGGPVSV
ncbi:unnamed protein product [Rhizoctonia solani]|uniref:Uncharacterized protein n=1 Tax=Rhizoctonia solani TaxID=456999 RepID=A0A8H3HV90_9AGAM|nr:unnamed protein product [Rhizoctonia solani]